MADKYIDKFKYNDRYFLLDSGATHESNTHYLSGTLGNFKSNGTIVAEQGLFNKLIATNASIDTLDANNLTAQNATVVGLLDVQGQLKTNSWTNSNIATIEGNFFIAPTVVSKSTSSTKYQLTIQNQTSTNSEISSITGQAKRGWVLTISGNFDLNQIGADLVSGESSTILNQWSQGSKVLITGDIEKTDGVYPLGTLTGFIYSSTTSSGSTPGSITIYNTTDNLGNTDIFTILGANTYNYREIKVSLTQRYYSGMRPIGILMSAQGRSSKSFIDIYGGANQLQSGTISGASSDYGGLAIPNVRIGNLRGLPNIRSGDFTNDAALPTGWGIYTDNGYFKGTIVSTSGEIGGYSLTANYLQSTDGTTGISVADNSTTASWAFWAGGTTTSTAKFRVDHNGVLYATGASIQGALTASTLSTGGRTSSTSAAGTFIDANGAIYGGNNKFTVTSAGVLTATDAKLNNLTIYDSSGNKRAAATTSGFIIYDGASATTTTQLASFGSTVKMGKTSGKNLEIGTDSFNFYNGTTLLGKIAGNDSGGINITSPNVNGYESYLTVSPQRLHMGISYNDGSDQLAVADLYYYVSSGYWGIPYEVRAYSLYQNGYRVLDESMIKIQNGTSVIDIVYPVGSTYITSSNSNPQSYLGGTWTLVDKQFKPQYIQGTNMFTINSSGTTSLDTASYALLDGHSIHIRLMLTNKVALSDSTVTLGTVRLANCGMTSGATGVYASYPIGYTDAGNGIIMGSCTNAGVLTSEDVVTKTSGGSVAASNVCRFDWWITCTAIDSMIDSFCDKFYWKRTA